MNIKKILGIILVLVLFTEEDILAQIQKRPLNHADYDAWESLNSEKITKNGSWVGYQVSPQDGDSHVEIFSFQNPELRLQIPRASGFLFSADDAFSVGKIVASKDTVKLLKLLKVKKEDMPADSLFIYQMSNRNLVKIPEVKSFAIPTEAGSWIAIHYEKEKIAKKDPADSTLKAPKPKKTEGTALEVRKLDGSESYRFERVKSYSFAPNGDFLQYVQAEEDTLDQGGIYLLNLSTGISKAVAKGAKSYLNASFSPQSKYLAFVATEDSLKSKKPVHTLYLSLAQTGDVEEIASKKSPGILQNGRISGDASLRFSEDEKRLFFGVAKEYGYFSYEDDSTILDEERVNLDIWGWQDAEIQPMQLVKKNENQKKSFLAAIDLGTKEITQLGDEEVENIMLESKIKHDFGLAWTDTPYRRNYSWDIQIGRDLYWIDFKTGLETLIEKEAAGYPSISPEGKYIVWYDARDSAWVAFDRIQKKKISLTKNLPVAFYDELHDSPSFPSGYGSAGWETGDLSFLVNDRYDVWKINPQNPTDAQILTHGIGRKSNTILRRQILDREEISIDSKSELLFSAFDEVTKNAGFYVGKLDGKAAPTKIMMTANSYIGLLKAKNENHLLIRKSTFQEYSDVYLGDLGFKNLRKASHLNLQQEAVSWGTVELVSYLANDGVPLQGLLFKPDGFDPGKKYPMITYFYERSSDGLHTYRAPAPSASTINIPYFVSNQYLVFVPDIKYDLGLPGPSAYNCIIPGIQSVIAKGGVDVANLAIQGQSWGGYQVAYLMTKTNMFKAAGAGAPVVNMTSAYGGIRWGTGMSRMFQYEQTQSRIGGTLWQKPLYYLENSPLFFLDRVTTPVLIMHNDADGSVPWYQGIEMFMALKRLDKPAWLLQYNGEDHNLVQRKNRKDLSIRLSQFFDYYLKGAPAPKWMMEGLPAVEKGKTLKYELSQ